MGGLALQGLDIQAAGADAETWEKAVRKLRGRLMPPPGSPQPEQQDIDAFVAWMENKLDTNPRAPKAGYVGLQRLSRTEYAAAVKALVGVEIVAKDVLPQDAAVEGFDNIASALNVSPTFMEQYVEAARTIAKKAIGDRSLDSTSYAAAAHRGVEAMPLGLRDGGMRLKHNFPVDGEYRFNVLFPDQTLGLYTGSLENEATLVLMIDGKVMFRKPIGGLNDLMLNNRKAGDGRQQIADRFRNVSLPIQAGVREVVVGFIDRSRFESTEQPGRWRWRRIAVVQQHRNQGSLQPDRRCLDGESQAALCLRSQGWRAKRPARSRLRRTWRGAPSAAPLPRRTSPG